MGAELITTREGVGETQQQPSPMGKGLISSIVVVNVWSTRFYLFELTPYCCSALFTAYVLLPFSLHSFC